ncbi:nitroreductase family protein [Actinoplanes sp. HUAS TT8]|uniref:nitroreductase family protein n=1 Tax=Actinoplanes sp. HUAS TT8 TaxID=3447453 RepID=UPI003F5216C8
MSDITRPILDWRPLLRRDAVLHRVDAGATLRTEREQARLAGAAAYPLLTRLRAGLTGERTVRQICAGLGPAEAGTVTGLVAELAGRGLVVDVGDAAAARWPAQRNYLAHLVPDPGERVRWWHGASVLLQGNGISLYAAATALLANGAGRLTVVPDDDDWPYRDALAASQVRIGATPNLWADLVVHCADKAEPAALTPLIRAARTGGPPLLALAMTGGWAVLGPLTGADGPGCWWCVHERLARSGEVGAAGTPTPLVARMLGGAVAFAAFRLLTGADRDEPRTATVQRLRTLRAARIDVGGGCAVCAPDRPRRPASPWPPPEAAPVIRDVESRPGESSGDVGQYAAAAHRLVDRALAPEDYVTDWGDRPPLFPTYPGAPLRVLPDPADPAERPFPASTGAVLTPYTSEILIWMLRRAYGPLARNLRVDYNHDGGARTGYPSALWRRGTASGGGLYPLQVYWVAGGRGIRHYAPGQHAFEELARGDAAERIRAAVGSAEGSHFLLISLRFWRNAFKYADLGYHIGTLDLGALLGSLGLLAAGVSRPFEALLDFDDAALNDALGLDPAEESVLAVVPLPWSDDEPPVEVPADRPRIAPAEASRTVLRFAWSARVHRTIMAARLTGSAHHSPARVGPAETGRPPVALPEPAVDPAPAGTLLGRRRSSSGAMVAIPALPMATLGAVLRWTERANPDRGRLTRLSVLVNHVDGLEPGGYRYDPDGHRLHPALTDPGPGWAAHLERIGRRVANYTLEQASAVLVVSGRADAVLAEHGPRGYRLLNAEVGAVVQAGYLAAAAAGIGAGAVLNLDHPYVDGILEFDGGERAVLCLLIGGEHDEDAAFEHTLG